MSYVWHVFDLMVLQKTHKNIDHEYDVSTSQVNIFSRHRDKMTKFEILDLNFLFYRVWICGHAHRHGPGCSDHPSWTCSSAQEVSWTACPQLDHRQTTDTNVPGERSTAVTTEELSSQCVCVCFLSSGEGSTLLELLLQRPLWLRDSTNMESSSQWSSLSGWWWRGWWGWWWRSVPAFLVFYYLLTVMCSWCCFHWISHENLSF